MVLADLLAAELASSGAAPAEPTAAGPPKTAPRHARPLGEEAEADEAARLAVTVAQLEHALTARVRVEQAIGVLAERHRLRTRDASTCSGAPPGAGADGSSRWPKTW